jgi:phospholipase C
MANQLGAVDHVVQLMLENRSFDHLLGFLYADSGNISPATGQPFEGLTGTESCPDSAGRPVEVYRLDPSTPGLYFMPGANPGEGFAATNVQLFGTTNPRRAATPTNEGFVVDFAATLTGADAGRKNLPGTTPEMIMGMYTPELLPVLSGLARGFAVCDHWYASVPTETFPNRAFASAATSQGHMDDTTAVFTVPSIFGRLSAANLAWSIYGYDELPLTRLDFTDTTGADPSHFGVFSDFTAAASSGNLGAYTFLEPSWGSSGNSQHPNYDVALGEQLIHDVYEALRNSPAWASTLLVITYDEHGGCYDHVPPPAGAVPPDASIGQFGFDFTRFGVRVPAVLVSPLIAAGTVFRPSGPTPLDHTSVLRTLELRFGLEPLTARDRVAPDLGDVLTLDPAAARRDDPLDGVTVPVASGPAPAAGEVSHIQQIEAELVAELPLDDAEGRSHPAPPAGGDEAAYRSFIARRMQAWQVAGEVGRSQG